MALSTTLCLVILVLAGFGTIQPILKRLGLTAGQAMIGTVLLLVGSNVPMLTVGQVRVAPGAILACLSVGVPLLVGQGRGAAAWAMLAAFVTGMTVFGQRMLLPGAQEQLTVPVWAFEGVLGGAAAGLLCRNGRCAMSAALLGVLAADAAHGAAVFSAGADMLILGHTELADEAMLGLVSSVVVSAMVTMLWDGIRMLMRRVRTQPGS